MNKKLNQVPATKRQWSKPRLNRLGTIQDVAGPSGASAQSPVQLRS